MAVSPPPSPRAPEPPVAGTNPSHGGLDLRGIARALGANLRAGEVAQGGSTITQQVAKSFLGSERTLQRKIREAILARRLESRYSTRDILTLYLNQIFLGNGAYG